MAVYPWQPSGIEDYIDGLKQSVAWGKEPTAQLNDLAWPIDGCKDITDGNYRTKSTWSDEPQEI